MLTNRIEIILLLLVIFEILLLPLASFEHVIYLSLFNAVLLIVIASYNLLNKINALYLAILGFGVLSFFDIFKFNVLQNQTLTAASDGHLLAAYWTYISFFIFLCSYILTKYIRIRKECLAQVTISVDKIKYIALPIATIITLVVLSSSTISSTIYLVSFFPKAFTVFLFYLFFLTRSKIYLLLAIIFLVFSYSEISRRIYITLFFLVTPIAISIVYLRLKKISARYKMIFVSIFILAFLYMNYLRSDYEFGEGYIEGEKITSTVNYMVQFKAIDTYDNTAFVFNNIPRNYDYYYGESYFAILVQFIPRVLWENKPVGFGAPLALLRKTGIREFDNGIWLTTGNGVSFSPGFIGEAYANFGILGIIILSILFGISAKYYDLNVKVHDVIHDVTQLPYLAFLSVFFLMLRGDTLMATYFAILFFLFLKLIIIITTERLDSKLNVKQIAYTS